MRLKHVAAINGYTVSKWQQFMDVPQVHGIVLEVESFGEECKSSNSMRDDCTPDVFCGGGATHNVGECLALPYDYAAIA